MKQYNKLTENVKRKYALFIELTRFYQFHLKCKTLWITIIIFGHKQLDS